MSLSSGALQRLYNGDTNCKPTFQLIDIKKIAHVDVVSGAAANRYRLIISDGVHFMQAMLATGLNGMVDSGQVQQHSVIQLEECLCNLVQNRKIIIILKLSVVASPGSKIGQPKRLEEGAVSRSMSSTRSNKRPCEAPAVISDIAANFNCPITSALMADPVTTSDGLLYEKDAIQRWLVEHDTSPSTGVRLRTKELSPAVAVRATIEQLVDSGCLKAADVREWQTRKALVLLNTDGNETEAKSLLLAAKEAGDAAAGFHLDKLLLKEGRALSSSSSQLGGASKGLPMSVLLEVLQQHPNLKTRIQEIISREDYTEAQKMSAIQQIVRDAGGN